MKNLALLPLLTLFMILSGCNQQADKSHPSGENIVITWEVLENHLNDANRFKALLTIVNNDDAPLPADGWVLYFNFLRTVIPESLPPDINISRVNGDFFNLEPTDVFESLASGQSLAIEFIGQDWIISESEAPCGFYFVFTNEDGTSSQLEVVTEVTIKPHLATQTTIRTAGDNMAIPTPASRYLNNLPLETGDPDRLGTIIPTPAQINLRDGLFVMDQSIEIHHETGLELEAGYLAGVLKNHLDVSAPVVNSGEGGSNIVLLKIGEVHVDGSEREAGDEAYTLSIHPDNGIVITGSDRAGVLYGIQSLRALLPIETYAESQDAITLPLIEVADAPRFGYRGLHLDVGRNFQTKEAVLKLLDLMAFYKLNKFHFHLTEDEGWRLPVEALPELTEIGGFRGHTLDEKDRLVPSFGSGPDPDPAVSHGSGYYTRHDFIEILRYARDRHIEVIPEIDMPGHARAAVKAMEARYDRLVGEGKVEEAEAFLLSDPGDRSEYFSAQGWNDNVINACRPSSYRFLETVVDEVIDMFAEAEAPLSIIHTGGDELPHGIWEESPLCKDLVASENDINRIADVSEYFIRRFHRILSDRGLSMAGWEEIALTTSSISNVPTKVPNAAFSGMDIIPYFWDSIWGWGMEDVGYKLANAGYKVVLCNASNLYFDLAYNKDPKEPGYYWAGFVDTKKAFEFVPLDLYKSASEDRMGNTIDVETAFQDGVRLDEASRGNILGIQGQIWGENARGQEWMEYLTFPKLLGLAERAWAKQPVWATIEDTAEREEQFARAWREFAGTLGRQELPRLDYLYGGVNYRIPLPGAIVEDGLLKANMAFPGLTIHFTTDGSEPTVDSQLYDGPIQVNGVVKLRAFDTRGRASRTSVVEVE